MYYPIDDNGNDIRVGDEVRFIGGKFPNKTIFQVEDIVSDNLISVLDPKDRSYYFKSMNCVRVYQGGQAKIERAQTRKRIPPYTMDISTMTR